MARTESRKVAYPIESLGADSPGDGDFGDLAPGRVRPAEHSGGNSRPGSLGKLLLKGSAIGQPGNGGWWNSRRCDWSRNVLALGAIRCRRTLGQTGDARCDWRRWRSSNLLWFGLPHAARTRSSVDSVNLFAHCFGTLLGRVPDTVALTESRSRRSAKNAPLSGASERRSVSVRSVRSPKASPRFTL